MYMLYIDWKIILYVYFEIIIVYFEKRSIGNYFFIFESGFFF